MAQKNSRKSGSSQAKSPEGRHGKSGGGRKRHNGQSSRVEEALPGVRERREQLEELEESGHSNFGGSLVEGASGMMRRAVKGVRGAGRATVSTVSDHPVASGLIGAGVAAGITALAISAARSSSSSEGKKKKKKHRRSRDEDDESHGIAEMAHDAVKAVRNGASELGEYAENGFSRAGDALKNGAYAIGSGLERGYEYSKEKAGDLWENHPLLMTASFLALGVTAGMLLPSTLAENKALGKTAGKITKRVTSKGRELLDEGRELASRVARQTTEAIREGTAGLSLDPEKIAGKVKRVANRLKDVVSDAVEG